MNEPRRYKDENDLAAMRSLLMAGRKVKNGTYYIHTGDLDWWLYYPPLEGAFWDLIYLWDDPLQPGRLHGWALISPGGVDIDVYAQPELRGSQIALDMYTWTEERAISIAHDSHKSTVNVVWIWHDDDTLGKYFRLRGYQLKRGYVYLERSLDDIPSHAKIPGGFTVRSCMGVPEVTARARAQYGSFGSSAAFDLYLKRFTNFMHSPVYDHELDVVTVALDGQIGAFCIVWVDPVNRSGHFEPVGTHPDYQRKGLGRAVMVEGLRKLQVAGMNTADVVAFEDNLAAIKLYESVGFKVINRLGIYEKDV